MSAYVYECPRPARYTPNNVASGVGAVICHLHLSPVCRMICLSLTSRVRRAMTPRAPSRHGLCRRRMAYRDRCTYWITFPLPENVFDSTTACYFSIKRRRHHHLCARPPLCLQSPSRAYPHPWNTSTEAFVFPGLFSYLISTMLASMIWLP